MILLKLILASSIPKYDNESLKNLLFEDYSNSLNVYIPKTGKLKVGINKVLPFCQSLRVAQSVYHLGYKQVNLGSVSTTKNKKDFSFDRKLSRYIDDFTYVYILCTIFK